ncbi:HgNV_071-like protein [Aratus pisonii nudivirus]|nr:HgNV_071-like protein [Aratus pisonii nudivirus]
MIIPILNSNVGELLVDHKSTIPNGILPNGFTGTFHNIEVTDHKNYEKNNELYKKVPIGLRFLAIKTKDNDNYLIDPVISGYRKVLDIASTNDTTNIKPLTKALSVVTVAKINGETIYLAGRFIRNEFYFIIGNKKSQILFKNINDIYKYPVSRMTKIARTMYSHFTKCGVLRKNIICRELAEQKYTVICKYYESDKVIHHQALFHSLSLTQRNHFNNYFNNKLLIGIGITEEYSPEPYSLTAFNVYEMLRVLKDTYYFLVPYYSIVDVNYFTYKPLLLRTWLKGVDFYYQEQNRRVIGMSDLETYWYKSLKVLKSCSLVPVSNPMLNVNFSFEALNLPDYLKNYYVELAESWFKWSKNKHVTRKNFPRMLFNFDMYYNRIY